LLINANPLNEMAKAEKISLISLPLSKKINDRKKCRKWQAQGIVYNQYYQYYACIVYARVIGTDHTTWKKAFGLRSREYQHISYA
jgi:hypothetical protein